MSRIFRRYYSASPPSTAESIAKQFLTKHSSAPPRTVRQLLDANQFTRFAATIPLHASASEAPVASLNLASSAQSGLEVAAGTPLPPCYHLAYFTPGQVSSELGADGTDTSYNPPSPFTRRMWAGGELTWALETGGLTVGEVAEERTTVTSAVAKKTKAGEEMVVVGVEKDFVNLAGETALVDKRSWIFRPAITEPLRMVAAPAKKPFPEASWSRDYVQDAVTLFRFSALTFNGHKIHYSLPWCREVEGHRGLVVHGPLNLLLMVEMWRDVVMGGKMVNPRRVEYRATSPLYAGEAYRVCLEVGETKLAEVRIVDSFGNTSMMGKIERF